MISVIILTKNSAKTVKKALDSVTFAKEVLICDTGSSDQTLSIAKTYSNVRIVEMALSSFGSLRNELSLLAKYDWILSLDSDEYLSLPLQVAVQNKIADTLDENCVYGVLRENYFQGKKITFCGWQNEQRLRLYHRKKTEFSSDFVHEKILEKKLRTEYFSAPLIHTPFCTKKDFVEKMHHYTNLFATQNKGLRSSYTKAFLHGMWSFFRAYLLQKGLFFGRLGLQISLYKAFCSYYKYAKLVKINRTCAIKKTE